MTSRVLILICGIAAALFALPAQAIYATKCNCSTSQQWITKARSMGMGTHYLYNFDAAAPLRKYQCQGGQPQSFDDLAKIGTGEGGVGTNAMPCENLVQLQVEQRYLNYFNDMVTVRDAVGPLDKVQVAVQMYPGDHTGDGAPVGTYNGYDMVNSSGSRNDMSDYLNENRQRIIEESLNLPANVVDAVVNLLQNLDTVITGGELLKIEITVTFTDGSVMKFTISSENGGRPTRVVGSGIDANNNDIAESNSVQYSGRYRFGGFPADYDDWFENMRRLGVSITGSGGGSIEVPCNWDGVTLTCYID